jgi:hypothetical protein
MYTPRLFALVAILCGASTLAAPPRAFNGCRAAYARTPYFVDRATRYEYFRDTVAEVKTDAQGNTRIGFVRIARWLKADSTNRALLQALRAALSSGTPVHVMLGSTDEIVFVDSANQHPSCN